MTQETDRDGVGAAAEPAGQRRAQIHKRTPLENACLSGIRAMEIAGAHPLLTEAQAKLIDAQRIIADWIDEGAPGASDEWVREAGPWRPNYYDYGFWGGFEFVNTAKPKRPWILHEFNNGRSGYGQQCRYCGAIASVSIDSKGKRGGTVTEECPRHPDLAAAKAFDERWGNHPAVAKPDAQTEAPNDHPTN